MWTLHYIKKLIKCFCCHEKALEYDEYDDLLDHCETQGQKCVTLHPDFQDNMLPESVLKIDVCRYLEENWPLDDEDLEREHKLYRLIAYQRCSRSVFQILRVTIYEILRVTMNACISACTQK